MHQNNLQHILSYNFVKSKAECQAVFEVLYVRNVTRLDCKCNIQVLNRDLYSTAYAPAETSELIRIIGKKHHHHQTAFLMPTY